jgi:glutathione S-transferase
MPLQFYYGSRSPFAWTVWLALEHKEIPHVVRRVMFDSGEMQSPAFLAMNPRGQVPVIDDDGFVLYESAAILEYLDAKYGTRSLFPADLERRSLVRQLICETHAYLYERAGDLLGITLFTRTPAPAEDVELARDSLSAELDRFEGALHGDWFVGELSAADLTIYPQLRVIRRVSERQPQHGPDLIPPKLSGFMARIEALPYYERTTPPHWRE